MQTLTSISPKPLSSFIYSLLSPHTQSKEWTNRALEHLLRRKISEGGVTELLLTPLQRPLEVDGQYDHNADDTHDHHVHNDVRLEGQVLHRILTTLG